MKLFCFIGPSGSGKSSIQHSIPDYVAKFLTHYVTRPVREGEIDGYHVKHISKEAFELLYSDDIIATHTEYAGNLYGAPLESLLEILNYDTPYHATATAESILQFKKLLGNDKVVTIYIKPPEIRVLKERMLARGDAYEEVLKRISHIYSAAELENEKIADYVVVNDNLDYAKLQVAEIIYNELNGRGRLL